MLRWPTRPRLCLSVDPLPSMALLSGFCMTPKVVLDKPSLSRSHKQTRQQYHTPQLHIKQIATLSKISTAHMPSLRDIKAKAIAKLHSTRKWLKARFSRKARQAPVAPESQTSTPALKHSWLRYHLHQPNSRPLLIAKQAGKTTFLNLQTYHVVELRVFANKNVRPDSKQHYRPQVPHRRPSATRHRLLQNHLYI